MKENHVLKSLAELSPKLLGAKPAPPEETESQRTQALVQETKQQTIQPGIPTVSDTRGYTGVGG